MRKVLLVTGETPEEFCENYNSIMAGLKFVDSTELIDKTTMYVFYEEEEPVKEVRYCAECLAYTWRGCHIKGGIHKPKEEACEDAKFSSDLTKEEIEYWEGIYDESQRS